MFQSLKNTDFIPATTEVKWLESINTPDLYSCPGNTNDAGQSSAEPPAVQPNISSNAAVHTFHTAKIISRHLHAQPARMQRSPELIDPNF